MTEQQAIDKLLAWWKAQIGYHEGSNNWTKYAEDTAIAKLYGWKPQNQPWCDIIYDEGMIACFGLKDASELTYQPIGKGSALCRTSAQYYKDNKAWYGAPQAGDQVFFYDSSKVINHTGIVESVSGGVVHTIEGNTSDMVARRSYGVGVQNIAGYGRPKWSVVATENAESGASDSTSGEVVVEQPKPQTQTGNAIALPTLQKGDTGEVVRAAQMLLNGRGCSCGIYGADGDFGGMTRAAVLAFQRRNGLEADGIVGINTYKALLGVN